MSDNKQEGKKALQTNLKKGQRLDCGFTILDIVQLDELQAAGIWAMHEKSGAEVFHVLNDDDENLFSFSFATQPDDDTGAAHILEHSVLCGSERYPLKDAFITLAQGSLQTFLNAWTFPDKTAYPASSVNEHDYFNLMSVYGDAVFRPLLPEWTFMQEGHRYEIEKDGALSVTGVVYNEMKGAYSSLETYAGFWSVKAVLPDTPYAFESGGDPNSIPDLTWEGLKDFHRRRYSPANCRIFLAGNIPTEKQLAFLDEQFFSSLERGAAAPPIEKAKRWSEPKKIHVPCPAGTEPKPTVFLSWLCGDAADTDECMALAALTEILLGHDGSPLTRALIESGLGEDITPVSGLESEIRETLFTAGLRGATAPAEQIEELILDTLRGLVKEGIPKEEIEAALLSIEFSQREVRRSGGPFSLVWMRRSLRGWLHGGRPWEGLLLGKAIAKVKEDAATAGAAGGRFFESMIQKYLLDNPHRALVVLEPSEDFLPQKEAEFARKLSSIEAGMSEGEKKSIAEKSAALEKFQSEAESPENLAKIPHLSRKDLSLKPDYIPRIVGDFGGLPALSRELYTNGITYADLAFPLDALSQEDYSWLPFFTRAALACGLPGMDYGEVSSLLARTVGGFGASLITASTVVRASKDVSKDGALDLTGRDWILFRLKCLDEKLAASLDLALRLISEVNFSDTRRLKDLTLEMKNEYAASLAPMGHSYAAGRSGRFFSRSRHIDEIWGGISQLEFVMRLADFDIEAVAAKMNDLKQKIAAGGLVANLTCTKGAAQGAEFAKRFGRFGAPAPRLAGEAFSQAKAPEVFFSPSLQVGFAAMCLTAAPFDSPGQSAQIVLSHYLSTGALWEDIRMKGGAYGAFASSDSFERCFSLASYRDPGPLRSLDAFQSILEKGRGDGGAAGGADGAGISESELEKTIIGAYAKETRPRTPGEKSLMDFTRFLYGIENDYLERKLERLVAVSKGDIAAAFEELAVQKAQSPVIIGGAKIAEAAAAALGVEVKTLPC
ncbi:MAG: insulinase family protein [Spirochaetes bacterium]|nr:insulinase family protein [Spirochaetota bacterium]